MPCNIVVSLQLHLIWLEICVLKQSFTLLYTVKCPKSLKFSGNCRPSSTSCFRRYVTALSMALCLNIHPLPLIRHRVALCLCDTVILVLCWYEPASGHNLLSSQCCYLWWLCHVIWNRLHQLCSFVFDCWDLCLPVWMTLECRMG